MPKDDGVLTCLVCGSPQEDGGEYRFSDNVKVYVCKTCYPAWRASEIWNHRVNSRPTGTIPEVFRDRATSMMEEAGMKPAALPKMTKKKSNPKIPNLRSSAIIRSQLDRWVVGQENAKMVVSTVAHRHYMRVAHRLSGDEVSASAIPKQTILLVGDTGCGKTLLVKKLATILQVPYVIPSAAHFTEEGYQGDSVNDVFRMLLQRSGCDGSERWGLIGWDEIDKKAKRDTSGHRDVSGLGVQQALLDQMEPGGSIIDITVPGTTQRMSIDTTDIFFILMGAFSDGMKEIVERRMGGRRKMGYDQPVIPSAGTVIEVTDTDLEMYGFMPEFCGRVGHIVVLGKLSRDEMRRILLDVDDASIPAAMRVAEQYGFHLKFDDTAIEAIISHALESNQGARKLASFVDRCVLQIFHEMPGRVAKRKTAPTVTVTEETVNNPDKFKVK